MALRREEPAACFAEQMAPKWTVRASIDPTRSASACFGFVSAGSPKLLADAPIGGAPPIGSEP